MYRIIFTAGLMTHIHRPREVILHSGLCLFSTLQVLGFRLLAFPPSLAFFYSGQTVPLRSLALLNYVKGETLLKEGKGGFVLEAGRSRLRLVCDGEGIIHRDSGTTCIRSLQG